MDKNKLNISNIETFLIDLIWKKVSDNVFLGALPSAIESEWKDMVVIDCASAIEDMNAYGYGDVNIFLYAKPKRDGVKNKDLLGEMEEMLNLCISESSDSIYKIHRGRTYADYDTDRQLHCNIIQLRLVVI